MQTLDPTRLSVVIVDHHRPDLLARALIALHASTRIPDEIIIVNVAAEDPLELDADVLEGPRIPATRILDLADNPGYAAACNRGFALADGGLVLFMNADVFVDPRCLAAVVGELEADGVVGVATPRLTLEDGGFDHACHRGIPGPLDSLAYKLRLHRLLPRVRRLGQYTMAWLDLSSTHDIEACSGAFLLARREALEAVGAWDERYWFYAEDLDLCLRIGRAGWRVRYVGSATATHVKGASSHLRETEEDLDEGARDTRRRVRAAIVASHELFYDEHFEQRTSRLVRPFVRLLFSFQRWRLGSAA